MGFSELLGLTPQESNRKVLRKRKRLWNWQWYSSNALTMCLHFSAALGIHMTTFSGQWAISRSAMCHQQVFINWQGTPKMIFCHGNWGGFFFKLVKLEDEKTCSASISEQVTLLVPDKQNKKVEKKNCEMILTLAQPSPSWQIRVQWVTIQKGKHVQLHLYLWRWRLLSTQITNRVK